MKGFKKIAITLLALILLVSYNCNNRGNNNLNIIYTFFEAINKKDINLYLKFLDKKRYKYFSKLINTDKVLYVFNYQNEKESLEKLFSESDSLIKIRNITIKSNTIVKVTFELESSISFTKTGGFDEGSFHAKGKLIFYFVKDNWNNLKITKIVEEHFDNKKPSVSLGFIKYYYNSKLYNIKYRLVEKKGLNDKKQITISDYTHSFIDRKSGRLKFTGRYAVVKAESKFFPGIYNFELYNQFGNKISNYKSPE